MPGPLDPSLSPSLPTPKAGRPPRVAAPPPVAETAASLLDDRATVPPYTPRAPERASLTGALAEAEKHLKQTGRKSPVQAPGAAVAAHPRTPDEAVRAAAELFTDPEKGDDEGPAHVERNSRFIGSVESDRQLRSKIDHELAANHALAAAAIEQLSPKERLQLQGLDAKLVNHPEGRLHLQVLLIKGDLPGARCRPHGPNTLDALASLAAQPLVAGIDGHTGELLTHLMGELHRPQAIAQHDRNTCTVTSLQILAASTAPAEYVHIVGGLASPEGRVQLKNGDWIARSAHVNELRHVLHEDEKPGAKSYPDVRTISARLWQSSMMNYAQPGVRYDNFKDTNFYQDGSHDQGLDNVAVSRALEGFTSKHVTAYVAGKPDAQGHMIGQAQLWQHISDHLAQGPIPASIRWGVLDKGGQSPDYHEVLARKVDAGRVYYNNPWGREESMPIGEFKQRLTAIAIPGR